MKPTFTMLYRARAELFRRRDRSDAERILKTLGAENLHDVPAEKYRMVLAAIEDA